MSKSKIVSEIDASDFEVLTPGGYQDLKSVMMTEEYDVWRIEFHDDSFIECADDHILILKGWIECFAKNLQIGDRVLSKYGHSIVTAVKKTERKENMYDIEIDSDDHLYFSNDLISHNTTTAAAYFLYEVVFSRDKPFAILANKFETAKEILDRFKLMFEYLPVYIKPGVVEWNKSSIEFSNGCKIFVSATSSSSIRGRSISTLYLDEFAHIDDAEEFFTSTFPVISSGKNTKVIITSTPNGLNLFYRLWSDAENKRNAFNPIKFTWRDHPDRDEKWHKEMLEIMSPEDFDVEFNGEFYGSSNTLLSPATLKRLVFQNPIEDKSNEVFKVYDEPIDGNSYVVTVDTAEGIGKDYTVISVFDVSSQPFRQAACYRSNTIPIASVSEILMKICKSYNEAFLIVETNSVGKSVADAMYYEHEYENMLISKIEDGEATVSFRMDYIGLRQTSKTKRIGCANLKKLIENDILLIQDFETIQELSNFIKKNNSYQADKKKTDDIVMTLVMFAWLTDQPFFEELTNENIRSEILRQINYDDAMLPIFFDNGNYSDDETCF